METGKIRVRALENSSEQHEVLRNKLQLIIYIKILQTEEMSFDNSAMYMDSFS